MAFFQSPPELGNQYRDDRVLRSYLARTLPPEVLRDVEPSLQEMGELAGGELYRLQQEDRLNEPRLTQWDPWGNRVDHIEVSPLWKVAARVAAEKGLVATAYERRHGPWSRVHQFALVHLFNPSTDVYSCPLAMTDGAARTLTSHGNSELLAKALPHLVSRDPTLAWTSGQWMTERTGGSDVGISETIARQTPEGWRLYGTKWFTSATTSQMALTLARPEGNGPGGSGLALFFVQVRGSDGRMNGILINRLKDKLGTRKVPTAELTLEGTLAVPVAGTAQGVRNITPMLSVTRTWNAICAICGMRRGLALARDYAAKRQAFGSSLREKPLHADTLAGLQAELEAGFQLAFRVVELMGREEAGVITERESELFRLLTPLAKLATGKQAVAVLSEVLESFGGAGYIEDTGLPMLLRDAQVLPIWEGTTNVLSLDSLRALAKGSSLAALGEEMNSLVTGVRDPRLAEAGRAALDGLTHARSWLTETAPRRSGATESGARRFALTLARSYALAAQTRAAQVSLDQEHDGRAAAAAIRFSRQGIDLIAEGEGNRAEEESAALAADSALTWT